MLRSAVCLLLIICFLWIDSEIGYSKEKWIHIPKEKAPDARVLHTAIWDGHQMIIWGGVSDGGIDLNTGGRYDPSTDIWTPIATESVPEARYVHTVIWTGTYMIVWGGSNIIDTFNDGGR